MGTPQSAPTAQSSAILLPPQCSLRETEALLDKLSEWPEGEQIVLDASEVEQMTSACALAVVSTILLAEEAEKQVAVLKPADPFVDAFSTLGLFKELMKMEFRQ